MLAVRFHKDRMLVAGLVSFLVIIFITKIISKYVGVTKHHTKTTRSTIELREQITKKIRNYTPISRVSEKMKSEKSNFEPIFNAHGKSSKLLILTFGSREISRSLEALRSRDDVIYWHEPIKILERMDSKWRGNDLVTYTNDPFDEVEYIKKKRRYQDIAEFYNEVFSCNFSTKIQDFLNTAAKVCPEFMSESKHLRDLFKCQTDGVVWKCKSPEFSVTGALNKLCEKRKFNVIVKENDERLVSLERLHNKLSHKNKLGLKVLHLARDPRATIYEFSLQGRVARNSLIVEVWEKVGYACRCVAENLKYGRKIGNNYRVFRYEDFLENQEILSLYKELDLTLKGPKDTEKYDWWREIINPEYSSAVENVCYDVMDKFGYMFLDLNVREVGESHRNFEPV